MPDIGDKSYKILFYVFIAAAIVVVGITGLKRILKPKTIRVIEKEPMSIQGSVKTPAVLDYNKLEKDADLQALMEKRKKEFGIEKGIDMILKSGESLKIGTTTISMREIREKIQLKIGNVVEKNIETEHITPQKDVEAYGIYVVNPGDNIWNIHFDFIKDFFQRRNIAVASNADESDKAGYSSGIGKILKFSENMVHIYNVREKKLDTDLNIIQPFSKIVVFNMGRILSLLEQVDYSHVNRIEYHGDTIWIPAVQS